jgi:hypothetical protein
LTIDPLFGFKRPPSDAVQSDAPEDCYLTNYELILSRDF